MNRIWISAEGEWGCGESLLYRAWKKWRTVDREEAWPEYSLYSKEVGDTIGQVGYSYILGGSECHAEV